VLNHKEKGAKASLLPEFVQNQYGKDDILENPSLNVLGWFLD